MNTNWKPRLQWVNQTFIGVSAITGFASSSWALEKYICHFEDSSDGTDNVVIGDVDLTGGFDSGRWVELKDGKHVVQFATYVGLVQVFIWRRGADRWDYSAMVPEKGFTRIDIQSKEPRF